MWYLGYHGFEAVIRLSTGRNGMRTYDMVGVHTDCPSRSQGIPPSCRSSGFQVGPSFATFIQYLESKSGWKPYTTCQRMQQVVQDLMQGYRRDNHLVWSTEKSTVPRRGGENGMALDVGDGVAWLERAEEAVVLGHVQVMEAGGVRMPNKLLRVFRAMLVVLQHHPPSVRTTLYYLRAQLNAAIGYQGMHLPDWREQLEEVEGEVRRLIRGYEVIPKEVRPAYYEQGMPTARGAYSAHTARTLSRMCHNQEEVVRRVCYHAVAEVQKEENMCLRYVWHR